MKRAYKYKIKPTLSVGSNHQAKYAHIVAIRTRKLKTLTFVSGLAQIVEHTTIGISMQPLT